MVEAVDMLICLAKLSVRGGGDFRGRLGPRLALLRGAADIECAEALAVLGDEHRLALAPRAEVLMLDIVVAAPNAQEERRVIHHGPVALEGTLAVGLLCAHTCGELRVMWRERLSSLNVRPEVRSN